MSEGSRRRRVAVGAAIGVGATFAMGATAQASDIPVTNTDDGGEGSLRAAIEAANLDPGLDRVLFHSDVSGRIQLDDDLPVIESQIEVVGPGPNELTIDGTGRYAIFQSGRDTTISGLTLTGGLAYSGGAIGVSDADLVVDDVNVESSYAALGGAISVRRGDMTIRDSEVTGNESDLGGGLYTLDSGVTITGTSVIGNEATVGQGMGGGAALYLSDSDESTITNSVFAENSASSGGGLVGVGGEISIDSSLITDNRAGVTGGLGLGSPNLDPTSGTVTNSTITGNETAQSTAGVLTYGDFTIESSTITGNEVTHSSPLSPMTGNAGLLQGGGTAVLRNSIVSGNEPLDLVTIPEGYQSGAAPGEVEGAFNLIGDRSRATFNETVAGSNIASTDPRLGPLRDNGGPTQTMLPADDSPVVNKGSSALTADARGLTRPIDFNSIPFSIAAGANGADIGAVELQGGPLPPPPNPTCETDPALCPVPPSNAFTFGKVKLNKKKGVATLQVKVPGAGKVVLLGSRVVKAQTKTAKAKATVNLTVKAKGGAAKQLNKKGKTKVRATVKFTPKGGTIASKSKTIKLVKKKNKKSKR